MSREELLRQLAATAWSGVRSSYRQTHGAQHFALIFVL